MDLSIRKLYLIPVSRSGSSSPDELLVLCPNNSSRSCTENERLSVITFGNMEMK